LVYIIPPAVPGVQAASFVAIILGTSGIILRAPWVFPDTVETVRVVDTSTLVGVVKEPAPCLLAEGFLLP
jgi:hypothetical protein